MRFSELFLSLFRFLVSPALVGTVYLYFYPFLHGCGFPEARNAQASCYFGDEKRAAVPGEKAPIRLLALGDPQLEGDTSLPGRGRVDAFPSLKRILNGLNRDGFRSLSSSLSTEGKRLWEEDLPKVLRTYHKKLDLWGNDLYLAHIYRTVSWHTDPTHVAVLGDLLGSQWINDEEFVQRSNRFWNTVFKSGQQVPRAVTDTSSNKAEILGNDKSWKNRIIAITGNHDIGYAGDIDEHRVERFEKQYGRVNWDTRFALNETTRSSGLQQTRPELRLVVLNSMNLDEPYANHELHQNSLDFLNQKLYWHMPPADTATILLTHIPLHKPPGICVDGPFFDYFPEDQGGGIKEQNHLTLETSELILDGLVGPERSRRAIILNGHDHAGCDTYHSRPKDIDMKTSVTEAPEDDWKTQRYSQARSHVTNSSLTGIREVTVRSMMGEFGGNAGLLSAWWDKETQEWKFDYASCMVGVQHIWWAVHALDMIVIGLGIVGAVCVVIEGLNTSETTAEKKRQ